MLSVLLVWMVVTYQRSGMAAPLPPSAQGSEQPQLEKGRQAVMQACTPCHGGIMRTIEAANKSAEQWRDTVYSMIGRGAHILPDEIEPITAYVVASSGRNRSASAAGSSPQRPLPEGEGKAILERRCQQCHDLERATTKLASQEWRAVVDRMVTQGAGVTAAELQTLIDYLTKLPSR
jgi:cytochrome c2